VAVVSGRIPSLSQITEWDTRHLEVAATSWSVTAQQWETHFSAINSGMLSPGGSKWEGSAAEAAQDRAWTDLTKVRGVAEAVRGASELARNGADDIAWARRQALAAIAEAEESGFVVAEDLSISDPASTSLLHESESRREQAREFAAEIGSRARVLASLDDAVADSIAAALAPLREVSFNEATDTNVVHQLGFKAAPARPDGALSDARRRAIEYADHWAGSADDPHRANPEYENFGDGGGDCTNFASQVMRAGGLKDVGNGIDDWHRGDADDWYYNNGIHFPWNDRSNTWSVAQANRDFIVNSGRGNVVGTAPMPTRAALDPLAPSKAGLVPGDLIYYHDTATGTINHTAVYVGQEMKNGRLVDVVDQHANGDNNFHNDWMPDGSGFTGGSASVEFVHLHYPGD
jgi:cell wall-associated NlpC family hydrolase